MEFGLRSNGPVEPEGASRRWRALGDRVTSTAVFREALVAWRVPAAAILAGVVVVAGLVSR